MMGDGKASSSNNNREDQALSPAARLFHAPRFNCYIITIIGVNTPINPNVVKAGLEHTLLKHPRFSSKLVRKGSSFFFILVFFLAGFLSFLLLSLSLCVPSGGTCQKPLFSFLEYQSQYAFLFFPLKYFKANLTQLNMNLHLFSQKEHPLSFPISNQNFVTSHFHCAGNLHKWPISICLEQSTLVATKLKAF